MSIFAKNLTEQDFREAADYFATQKSEVFCRVIQSAGVPKTYADDKFMRLPQSEGGTQPLGACIVTVPMDTRRTESHDPHSGFIAYVPPGSLKKGEALVKPARMERLPLVRHATDPA